MPISPRALVASHLTLTFSWSNEPIKASVATSPISIKASVAVIQTCGFSSFNASTSGSTTILPPKRPKARAARTLTSTFLSSLKDSIKYSVAFESPNSPNALAAYKRTEPFLSFLKTSIKGSTAFESPISPKTRAALYLTFSELLVFKSDNNSSKDFLTCFFLPITDIVI